MKKRIYLAGPEVFLPNAIEVGRKKKALCENYGFIGNFPLDNEIEFTKYNNHRIMARIIFEANESMILDDSDIIIANLTPFRGPNADVGTVYEVGVGCSNDKLVVGYSNISQSHYERISNQYFTYGPVDSNNHMIENFGLVENLMIDIGIEKSGGFILTGDASIDVRYTDLSLFENCLKELKKRLY